MTNAAPTPSNATDAANDTGDAARLAAVLNQVTDPADPANVVTEAQNLQRDANGEVDASEWTPEQIEQYWISQGWTRADEAEATDQLVADVGATDNSPDQPQADQPATEPAQVEQAAAGQPVAEQWTAEQWHAYQWQVWAAQQAANQQANGTEWTAEQWQQYWAAQQATEALEQPIVDEGQTVAATETVEATPVEPEPVAEPAPAEPAALVQPEPEPEPDPEPELTIDDEVDAWEQELADALADVRAEQDAEFAALSNKYTAQISELTTEPGERPDEIAAAAEVPETEVLTVDEPVVTDEPAVSADVIAGLEAQYNAAIESVCAQYEARMLHTEQEHEAEKAELMAAFNAQDAQMTGLRVIRLERELTEARAAIAYYIRRLDDAIAELEGRLGVSDQRDMFIEPVRPF